MIYNKYVQNHFQLAEWVETISDKMEKNLKLLPFWGRCVIISTARKNENSFSGKDELMGNLKAAALACGVVASVLGGGIGVTYITSTTIRTADLVTEENAGVITIDSAVSSTSATAGVTEKATAKNRTTTKKSNLADNSSFVSKKSGSVQEGTTSKYGSSAAKNAVKVSRSVPAPAHAPAAITQPPTQPATTASIIASAADVVKETTSALRAEISSTTTQATTTTTTTTSTTTVTTTAVTTTTAAAPVTEAPVATTETYVEPAMEPVVNVEVSEGNDDSLPITDREYILLCNAVAHEAGSDWISEYNKALVVEVIMNRVNASAYPNSIYGVLTQPYQFSGAWGYVDLTTYSSKVTQSVKNAVTLYFSEPDSFTQGYYSFRGNGRENYFF